MIRTNSLLNLIVCLLFFFNRSNAPIPANPEKNIVVKVRSSNERNDTLKLIYRIIPGEEGTWGYDVYKNKKLLIHQPVIPAVEGNKGFINKKSAEIVAKKVIEKIMKGEMPPSVTVEEMKTLKAI